MTTASDIRAAVYQELNDDPMVDTADIVVDVLGRDVSLNGTVPSQEQRSEAGTTAQRVPGVAGVHNLLDVALPSMEYGDDRALEATANQALNANPIVPSSVTASAREGQIYLAGWVTNMAEKAAAEDTVTGVGGVLGIVNQIEVTSAG